MSLLDWLERTFREQAATHPETRTLPECLETMFSAKYTGLTIVHWHEGRIKTIQIPNPITVRVK